MTPKETPRLIRAIVDPRLAARKLGRRLGRKDQFRRVLRRLVRVPADRRWAFILGCYNSGTTLVHDLVARSSACARLPGEGVHLTAELLAPEDLGWTRMWWKVEERMRAFGDGGGGNPEVVKRDWCIWFDTDRPVFLEKSISNSLRIPWIAENFPSSRFVYLVRNGYAVSEGIRRRSGRGMYPLPNGLTDYPIEWCAQQWVRTAEVVEPELTRIDPERVLRLTYEGFCADPAGWLARLGGFLGLPDLPSGDLTEVRDQNASAIGRLSVADVGAINSVAAGQLGKYGYEVLLGRDAGRQ